MNYDPKSIFNKEEHGNPFDIIQEGINWLLNETKKLGYQAQVTGKSSINSITRYARSQVTQHTDLNQISFMLKLVKGKKVVSASTTYLGQKGLQSLLDNVVRSIKITPEINFYQGLPDKKSGVPTDLSGKSWSIEDRADVIIQAVNSAEEIDKNVILAGTCSEELQYNHIMSTEGIDVESSYNKNYFKVNAISGTPENRGYGQEEVYWRYELPDIVKLAKEATQTAVYTTNLRTLDAKEYEVLLGPQAVSDLLVYLSISCEATSFHESNSFTSDRLGEQIFDKKFNLEDLPRDPHLASVVYSFDEEGIPSQNQTIIENGVLKYISYDSFTAAKYLDDKNLSSGNLSFWFNNYISFPTSAVISKGNESMEQQISEIDDGLWVKNFWYNRFTKRREGGLTGLTRNGLYYVKNGEIQSAVRNLRYTESFVRAFEPDNIISISKERTMFARSTCPSIHLKRYNFSSIAHTAE